MSRIKHVHSQSAPDLAKLRQAISFHRAGQLARAERIYRDILAKKPASFNALHLLGVIQHQKGEHDSAVQLISDAIRLNPNDPGAHSNHGLALYALKRPQEALASYDRALALKPDSAEVFNNRGNALRDLKRPHEALISYDLALASQPQYAEALNNRAAALQDLGRIEEALAAYNYVLSIKPSYAEALFNRGNALRDLGRNEEALASYDCALRLTPSPGTLTNRGNALRDLARPHDALSSYARALGMHPSRPETHWNESLCRLLIGDFESGWLKHEWRFHVYPSLNVDLGVPRWDSESLEGRTILLTWEQGLGDTLQFVRYASIVAKRAAAVILLVPESLQSLLTSIDGVAQVCSDVHLLPPYDLTCPLLSLPLRLGTTIQTIPAQVPYLHAKPSSVAMWKECLEEDGTSATLRVGLVWAGHTRRETQNISLINIDARRSVRLQQLAPLTQVKNVVFYSLQKGEATVQAKDPPEGMRLIDHTDQLNDFADTAALIMNLDLVISVDTSVVHLAGALGKPVWVLNRFDTCWRWMLDREDSPWYPTARLFRQPAPGDWASVIERVRTELQQLSAPVSRSAEAQR